MQTEKKIPELLAPAGSLRSMEAAVAAGADAVYFGAKNFNARAGAENFSDEDIVSTIRRLKILGVKSNITMNTQLYDGEIKSALYDAERVLNAGADAIITADLGLASQIKRYFPEAQLHASTQACGENIENAKVFEKLGFSRMVAAREISLADLRLLCEGSPIETEIFVHGALCVSHSGACLMSSVIGGRSGNRGECAQPCRLPYKCRGCEYPLSLKDISLASHIEDILPLGVASLKIEGRMKSPEYVYGVISVYRRLLDEGRNATKEEMEFLASLFSRSGFTDGYFEKNISRAMLGVRTDANKSASREAEIDVKYGKKLPIKMQASIFAGEPIRLSGRVDRSGQNFFAEVEGTVAEEAKTSPMSGERVKENLLKLGQTFFEAESGDITVDIGENVMVPISALNALRRSLCEKFETELAGDRVIGTVGNVKENFPHIKSSRKTAYFVCGESVTSKALCYFDDIFVPADEYILHGLHKYENVGIAFQPIAFDTELCEIREKSEKCASLGCRKALITNLWQVETARKCGFALFGDMRLNIWNPYSAAVYERLGFCAVVISPELSAARAERLGASIERGAVVYGKIPVMTLEKCMIRDINGLSVPREKCTFCDARKFSYLKDRTDTIFPVTRESGHRNVIFNSVPIYMLDKNIGGLFSHFVFTDEKAEEVDAVIDSAKKKLAPKGKFKRI